MEEKSRAQELSVREISLIRELAQIRKEHKRELEYEKFDGYELPPRTQFSMLNKPAVSIKYIANVPELKVSAHIPGDDENST